MSLAFAEFAEKLIPISDFSQGKAGKIFNDVAEYDHEYIVLKNNQPTAVVMSIREYKKTQEMVHRLEKIMELIENHRLLSLAESRTESNVVDFEELVKEEGLSMEELQTLAETVEFE